MVNRSSSSVALRALATVIMVGLGLTVSWSEPAVARQGLAGAALAPARTGGLPSVADTASPPATFGWSNDGRHTSGPEQFCPGDDSLIDGGVVASDMSACEPCCAAVGWVGHDGEPRRCGRNHPWSGALWEPLHPHGNSERVACWTGRGEALILWRNSPAARPLYTSSLGPAVELPAALDASEFESPGAGGARLQLFGTDACGNGLEIGWLYGGQFFSRQGRPEIPGGYLTAPPGLDGVDSPLPIRALDQVGGQLIGSLQSAEINRRVKLLPQLQFLYGFRWFQWYEAVMIEDRFGAVEARPVAGGDEYLTSTTNNLWGGQIGFDALLLQSRHGFRVEGVVKAGAYGNAASQASRYRQFIEEQTGFASGVSVTEQPASGSFVGEVGMTGVVPLCDNWDFRFGYLGLWLTALAQPTNQLSGQNIAQGVEPPTGTLVAIGTVVVQGVTLGLEGRW